MLTILPTDPSTDPSTPLAPARILKGHTRAIISTAIISRGRNILSAAKDGTVRLWDVGSGTRIALIGVGRGAYTGVCAMCVDVGDLGSSSNEEGQLVKDEKEVGTEDKLAFCALQDGSFEVLSLASKSSLFHSASTPTSPPSSLSAIAYSSKHKILATGTSNGLITVYSTASLDSLSLPIASFTRNKAAVEDLSFIPDGRLVVVTDDGLPFIARLNIHEDPPTPPQVDAELVGGDCEGIRVVRIRDGEGEVWTAGDDGVVRVYSLKS